MLELILSGALALNSSNLPPNTKYSQNPKPLASVESSKDDLDKRLFEEANAKARKNPLDAVEDYMKLINTSIKYKEVAIEKIGNIYEYLVIDKESNEKIMRKALIFYNYVIEDHSNTSYIAKANLLSGILVWQIGLSENSDNWMINEKEYFTKMMNIFERSKARLLQAYKSGSRELQSEAAWRLGLEHSQLYHLSDSTSSFDIRKKSLIEAKHYFELVPILNPNNSHVEAAKNLLESIDY